MGADAADARADRGWLDYHGFPIASPAALGKIKQQFVQAVHRYADSNQIPWVTFAKGDRKLGMMRPTWKQLSRPGCPRWWRSGRPGSSSGLRRDRKAQPGVPWFRFYRTERLVTCYYFYIWDACAGAGFIKACAYVLYPVKAWLNGHEITRRMAIAAGIAVTPLANGFASASDPAPKV